MSRDSFSEVAITYEALGMILVRLGVIPDGEIVFTTPQNQNQRLLIGLHGPHHRRVEGDILPRLRSCDGTEQFVITTANNIFHDHKSPIGKPRGLENG